MLSRSSLSAVLYRSAILLAIATAGCIDTLDVDDAELELSASYKAQVKNRTLSIVGNSAASSLIVRLGATAATLEVDVGGDGSADFSFDRATFERIRVDGGGGNDVITMNEQLGAFTTEEQVSIAGGAGDDTLTGGFGAETILGGSGNDTVVGRGGLDTISLGTGDDTSVWEPGGASDVVEGDDGLDRLVFRMAGIGEEIDLSASGDRLRLTRNVATVAMDLHAVEVVDLPALGGADRIVVHDLTAALVAQVNVDLTSSTPGQGDAQADVVVIDGTTAADTVDVWRDGDAVVATAGYTEVAVTGGEPALDRLVFDGEAHDRVNVNGSPEGDTMVVVADASGPLYDGGGFGALVAPGAVAQVVVHGLGGDDQISTSGGVLTPLTFDGGDGADRLFGGHGDDVLIGGAGADVVDGQPGADQALLGDGDDTYLWDPGDGIDVIDGELGADALIFAASGAGDAIDLRASGSRVSVYRAIGASTTDLGGIERIDVRARGGADTIVVNPLAGTSATEVNIDLAAYDGASTGDTLADAVIVNGATGVDTIDVTADGGAVVATGIGGVVRVRNGEPALDRMVVYGGLLNVNGSPGADIMTAVADASGTVYDGGGFNVLVAATAVPEVMVHGLGGDDQLGTSGGVVTALHLDGGDGDDLIRGGHGADVLLGGAGNDIVDGNAGADTAMLGAGDDTYLWDPGDGIDVLDGELGADGLIFTASGAGEIIELRASGSGAEIFRNIGTSTTALDGIERVDLRARGGADTLVVRDLSGTPVTQVDIDLGSFDGSQTSDAQLDSVAILGTAAADAIAIAVDAGAVLVSGLPAAVRIARPDVIDHLDLYGLGGVDTFLAAPGLEGLITLTTYPD